MKRCIAATAAVVATAIALSPPALATLQCPDVKNPAYDPTKQRAVNNAPNICTTAVLGTGCWRGTKPGRCLQSPSECFCYLFTENPPGPHIPLRPLEAEANVGCAPSPVHGATGRVTFAVTIPGAPSRVLNALHASHHAIDGGVHVVSRRQSRVGDTVTFVWDVKGSGEVAPRLLGHIADHLDVTTTPRSCTVPPLPVTRCCVMPPRCVQVPIGQCSSVAGRDIGPGSCTPDPCPALLGPSGGGEVPKISADLSPTHLVIEDPRDGDRKVVLEVKPATRPSVPLGYRATCEIRDHSNRLATEFTLNHQKGRFVETGRITTATPEHVALALRPVGALKDDDYRLKCDVEVFPEDLPKLAVTQDAETTVEVADDPNGGGGPSCCQCYVFGVRTDWYRGACRGWWCSLYTFPATAWSEATLPAGTCKGKFH